MTTMPSVHAEHLGRRYGRTWALRDCTLSMPEGKVIALVGPNGAGKTTLLRLIVGLLAPTEGSLRVFGESPATNTPQALARVGFVAQEHPLFRRFTVADLLRFGRWCNLRFDLAAAQRRLSKLEIPLDRRAGALSGGQQAQVALTLALAKRPDLIVLDEPLASLDPVARREFLRILMGAVADEGVTVLFSSHVISDLQRVCEHLVLINRGRVALAGDIDDLLSEHRMLVGPRTDADTGRSETVIEAIHADRHTSLLVRDAAAVPAPGWQTQPVGLEDLVLAYLRRPTNGATDPSRLEVAA